MADTFDKIMTGTPLNSTAGRVTSKGEHYTPSVAVPYFHAHWDAPPAMRPFVGDPTQNLTGTKVQRFTVIGLLDDPNGSKWRGRRWVVRCVCGDYEARSAKAITKLLDPTYAPNPQEGRCFNCSHTSLIQRRYEKKGSKPLVSFSQPQASPGLKEITVKLRRREDGGLHISAPDMPSLNLSGPDQTEVLGRLLPALQAMGLWR